MDRMKSYKRWIAALALWALPLCATYSQSIEQDVREDISRAADIYHSYEYRPTEISAAPEGYTLFYVSHFGRHGSRFLEGEERYASPLATLRRADGKSLLTAEGERCLAIVEAMAENARSRWGELTQRGVREHRQIAQRMYMRMPEIFAAEGTEVRSRSTLVPRCIMSMAANNERLKELNPSLNILRDASGRWRDIFDDNRMAHRHVNAAAEKRAAEWRMRNLDPSRLMHLLFVQPGLLDRRAQVEFMQELYTLWADEQDVDWQGESLATILDREELIACWKCSNMRYYMPFGPSEYFVWRRHDARRAVQDLIERADAAIADPRPSADLRFIHDSGITSMMSLMGICELDYTTTDYATLHEHWAIYRITPMATNLQIMFYRSPASDEVLVKLLLCEREVSLPLESSDRCYRWSDVKAYLSGRIDDRKPFPRKAQAA